MHMHRGGRSHEHTTGAGSMARHQRQVCCWPAGGTARPHLEVATLDGVPGCACSVHETSMLHHRRGRCHHARCRLTASSASALPLLAGLPQLHYNSHTNSIATTARVRRAHCVVCLCRCCRGGTPRCCCCPKQRPHRVHARGTAATNMA